jgi:hypothetical protein
VCKKRNEKPENSGKTVIFYQKAKQVTRWLYCWQNEPEFLDTGMCKNLRLLSLNINGKPHTLESLDFKAIICDYDFVFLQEIKHIYVFSITGFQVLRSSIIKGEERRGGVAVLFSSRIWPFVYGTSTFQDQVWFSLSFAKNISFGAINQEILHFLSQLALATFRKCHLTKRLMLNFCKNSNLFPVNHLETGERHFIGDFTYRKGTSWTFQINWAFVSESVIFFN